MSDDRPPTVVVQPAQGVVAVAADTVGALRSTPVLLVMVLLNAAFIGAAAYYLRTAQDHAYALINKMFDRCLPEHVYYRPDTRSVPSPPARPVSPTPGYEPPPNEHQGSLP
jgi:hypothetical protein